ncbi:signal peptide peptidase SppA [Vibrio sp.]|uniref:signal peptide peptidase SppA n=1 Tax=Vibrio sp. TaxID=678 RepID=UPI003D0D71E9
MKQVFKFIGMVFKGIWKLISFIRLALTNLFFILTLVILYYLFTSTESPIPQVEKKSALVLNLSGPIVEQATYINPMDSFTGSLIGKELPKENVLYDLVKTIRYAKNDDKISGLVLSLSDLSETHLTKLRYIAKALNEFKAAGKPIYAVGDVYNQSQYYLASYADKVFLSPDGLILLKGYSRYSLYYKSLLENLEVNTHVFRVGTYKSAIEPFIRDDMSDAAKQSASVWLGQMWGAYVDDVATNRQVDPAVLSPSMDSFLEQLQSTGGDLAALMLKVGLVDELANRLQVRSKLVDAFGSDGEDSYNAIGYYDYLDTIVPDSNQPNQDEIAIVVASGAIMDGSQPRGAIGGDSTAALLRQARNDDQVKAVVLRVDSPGGSAFASEVIRNEIDAIKAAGKPVVVSMSSLAASGGYWISMSADQIIAQPTTLTGSIGIFSVITTFEKGLNKMGIYTDGIGTSPFSGSGVTTGLSDGVKQVMQLGIEHGYQRFTGLVSESRRIDPAQMDDVAQGRVWTGQDALRLGLVDRIGDFDDAIKVAAELAKLDQYQLMWVSEPLSPAEQFMQNLMKQVQVSLGIELNTWLPASFIPVSEQLVKDAAMLNSFNDPKGQYAFCLNCQML